MNFSGYKNESFGDFLKMAKITKNGASIAERQISGPPQADPKHHVGILKTVLTDHTDFQMTIARTCSPGERQSPFYPLARAPAHLPRSSKPLFCFFC